MIDLLSRRLLLGTSLAAPLAAQFGLATRAQADAPDAAPALPSERSVGNANAKVVVQEWFSLTCTHCAAFAQNTFPEVKAKLIDTGRIRYVFHDFPLDQVALMAAIVARALPPERYEPFVLALLDNQQHWAFGENVDPQAQLQKMAALAGLSPDRFAKVIADPAGQQEVLSEYKYGETTYKIDSTPTFIFGTEIYRLGDLPYADFEKHVVAQGG